MLRAVWWQVYLVLWYREGEGEPLYSYDARHGDWNRGARWSDRHQFGPRAHFQLSSSPAELRVENISSEEVCTSVQCITGLDWTAGGAVPVSGGLPLRSHPQLSGQPDGGR